MNVKTRVALLAALVSLVAPSAALARSDGLFDPPIVKLNALIGNINGLRVDGYLKPRLVAPLQAAKQELHKFRYSAACYKLDSFNSLVMSSYGFHGLTYAQALIWSDAAYTIQGDLGCGIY